MPNQEVLQTNFDTDEFLAHFGILGMKWGIRRFQNKDGSLTDEGRRRYLNKEGHLTEEGRQKYGLDIKKGQELTRVSSYKTGSKDPSAKSQRLYVTSNEEDASYYRSEHYSLPFETTGVDESERYVHTYVPTVDLRSPDKKEREEIVETILKTNKEAVRELGQDMVKNTIFNDMALNWEPELHPGQKMPTIEEFFEQQKKETPEDVDYLINNAVNYVNDVLYGKNKYNDSPLEMFRGCVCMYPKLFSYYKDELKKRGYNCVIDDEDAGKQATAPLIIIEPEKNLKYKGSRKLTESEIEEATKNYDDWKSKNYKQNSKDVYWSDLDTENFLAHHGILGQKWGIRRYQNPDGSLTEAGRKRYHLDVSRGSTITRMSKWANASEDPNFNTHAYVTNNKGDASIYRTLYWTWNRNKSYKGPFYEEKFIANVDIKSPDEKERKEITKKILSAGTESLKHYGEYEVNKLIEKYSDNMNNPTKTEEEREQARKNYEGAKADYDDSVKKYCEDIVTMLSTPETSITFDRAMKIVSSRLAVNDALFNDFKKELEARGYNAILDDNDRGALGESPMIIIDPKKNLTQVSSRKVGFKERAGFSMWRLNDIQRKQAFWSATDTDEFLAHYGILGQRWGIRRFQNPDGTLTEAGKKRYLNQNGELNEEGKRHFGTTTEAYDVKTPEEAYRRRAEFTDEELKKILDRFSKEAQLDALSKKYRTNGKVKVDKMLAIGGAISGSLVAFSKTPLGKGMINSVKKEIRENWLT